MTSDLFSGIQLNIYYAPRGQDLTEKKGFFLLSDAAARPGLAIQSMKAWSSWRKRAKTRDLAT